MARGWARIGAGGRVFLKIFVEWKPDIERRTGPNCLAGQGCAFANIREAAHQNRDQSDRDAAIHFGQSMNAESFVQSGLEIRRIAWVEPAVGSLCDSLGRQQWFLQRIPVGGPVARLSLALLEV